MQSFTKDVQYKTNTMVGTCLQCSWLSTYLAGELMADIIDEKVNRDFTRARSAAFMNAIRSLLRRQSIELLPLNEVRSRIYVRGQRDLGILEVPLDQIIGSEGRYTDFDRFFLPLSDETEERWKKIGRAYYQDVVLPPIDLVKIRDLYFVRDGNHRVSVARMRGQVDIDARVVELKTDVTLPRGLQQGDLLLVEEQSDFLEWTRLAELCPGVLVEVSELGSYLALIRHINGHRYFLGLEHDREVPSDEAVISWYESVYIVLVSAIRRSGVLQFFPDRTETDLYLWIMDHRHYLTEQVGHDLGPYEAVARYTEALGPLRARRYVVDHRVAPAEQDFLRATGLDRIHIGTNIQLTAPEQYAVLWRHINDHQYYLGLERQCEVPLKQAAASWYDQVYRVVIDEFTRLGGPELFPAHTAADLYVDAMEYLSKEKDWREDIDLRGVVAEYINCYGARTLLHNLVRYSRRFFGRGFPSGSPV